MCVRACVHAIIHVGGGDHSLGKVALYGLTFRTTSAWVFAALIHSLWVYVTNGQHSLSSVTFALLLYPVFSQTLSHCSPPPIHLIFLSSLPVSVLGLSGHII